MYELFTRSGRTHRLAAVTALVLAAASCDTSVRDQPPSRTQATPLAAARLNAGADLLVGGGGSGRWMRPRCQAPEAPAAARPMVRAAAQGRVLRAERPGPGPAPAVTAEAANIELVRKMCPLLRDRFKQKPAAK
jgi:hypothetical protein